MISAVVGFWTIFGALGTGFPRMNESMLSYFFLNGSEESGIDVLRTKIKISGLKE